MSVTGRALREQRRLRIALDRQVDTTTRAIVGAWSRAWQEVIGEYQAAIADLYQGGEWPSRAAVLRAERARSALRITVAKIEQLADLAGVRISRNLPAVLEAAVAAERRMKDGQMPQGVTVNWARVSDDMLDAIVTRTTQQVTQRLWPLSGEAEQAMKSALVRGIASGANPRTAAADMLARVEGVFNGGRWRAENIARTEMLDAARAAALADRQADRAVLRGWQWVATLNGRTCPACLAMHGTMHNVDEPGPLGHQSCRCVGVPVTKSWAELGIRTAAPEPPSTLPDAQSWFDRQPAATQREIMGTRRLADYQSGRITWQSLPVRRSTAGWRDSYVTRRAA